MRLRVVDRDESLYERPASDLAPQASVAQLISTKFHLPRLPRNAVERPRLMALLDVVRGKRLALIESPSGFGKTSLAVAWAHQLEHESCRVAWLSLDEGDDEIVRFLHYLVTAIELAYRDSPLAMGTATSGLLLSMPTVIGNLINALSQEEEPLFLFLDGYHHLRHPQIHEAVTYLILHAPECLHLVLTSCSMPPLPLAKLRASGELLEIDTAKLCFSLHEIEQFLRLSSGHGDSTQIARILQRKTGGWIAALNLALSGLDDATEPERYIEELSGESRQIGDYLNWIWEGLPADLREFMLRSSILDRLTAPLCEAVTGIPQGQRMLEAIERQHLLLVPLDQGGIWFRNHNLMSEYLRRRLRETEGEQVAELHRRAAAWYASNDMWTSAIRHAIAAGDRRQATEWIERNTLERVRQGDLMAVLGWYRLFPEEMTRFPNQVRLAIVWAHGNAARVSEARDMMRVIGHDLAQKPADAEPAVRQEYRILQCVMATISDDSSAALDLGLECLKLESDDPWFIDVVGNMLRFGYLKACDFRSVVEVPWFSTRDPKDFRFAFQNIYRQIVDGMLAMQQARFAAAEKSYWDAYRMAEQHYGEGSLEIGITGAMVAEALYEQNRLNDAATILNLYLERISTTATLDPMLSAYYVLARVHMLQGNPAQADAILQRGIGIGHERQWGRLNAILLQESVRQYLQDQRMSEAEACVAQIGAIALAHPVTQTCAWSEIHVARARAQSYLDVARGDLQHAIKELGKVYEDAAANGNCRMAIRAGTELASALRQAAQLSKAEQVFEHVLALAIPADAARAIADHGVAAKPLLDTARRLTTTPQREEFLRRVEKLLGIEHSLQEEAATGIQDYLLSARESSILSLVTGGQSNKQIAKTLGITPETVKSHLKNAFIKLNVTTRAQAVGRLLESRRNTR